MGFGDYQVSLRMRDVITRMVRSTLDLERPKYRYGTVQTIDRANWRCTVLFQGDTTPITVVMGSVQPSKVGQLVRVAGIGADRYIDDVMGAKGLIMIPTGVAVPFPGVNAPYGALICDGTSYLRATYPDLFTAITFTITGTGASGQNIVTTADTSNVLAGMKVEGAGVPANATVLAVTSGTTFTLSSNISTTLTGANNLTIIIHGCADSTHFYVPDYRGKTIYGRNAGDATFAKIGQTGGAKAVSHTHPGVDHLHGTATFSGNTAGYSYPTGVGAPTGSAQQLTSKGAMDGHAHGMSHNHGSTGAADRSLTTGDASDTNNMPPFALGNWIIGT